jgi:hypothetical protein
MDGFIQAPHYAFILRPKELTLLCLMSLQCFKGKNAAHNIVITLGGKRTM